MSSGLESLPLPSVPIDSHVATGHHRMKIRQACDSKEGFIAFALASRASSLLVWSLLVEHEFKAEHLVVMSRL